MSETYSSLDAFLPAFKRRKLLGPVALTFVEDDVKIDATLAHNRSLGFAHQVVFSPKWIDPPQATEANVVHFECVRHGVAEAVTRLAAAQPGTWFYYSYNAEFLYFPFCETRSIGEMLEFHSQERRSAVLTYVVDLYGENPEAFDLGTAFFDATGYFGLARDGVQQMEFYGGLKWRFQPHIPHASRHIDRIGLFRATKGLRLQADHRFNLQEYNSYSCPWHHNLTAAICSFRTAKALANNPGSRAALSSFTWNGSAPFEKSSQQLLDLGLIEPGQWF